MHATFDFSHQRILVTGASSGIGREIAQQLIASGARVFALGRDAQALAALGCRTLCVDIADSIALDKTLQDLPPCTAWSIAPGFHAWNPPLPSAPTPSTR